MNDRWSFITGMLLALLFFVFLYYGRAEDDSVDSGMEQDNAVVVQDIFEDPVVYYELTAEERDLLERVVMGEAGGEEYAGQLAVAQCILNACELRNARPAAIIESLSYTTHRPEASQSVKDAVSEVFDDGVKILPETAMYFYAPGLVYSEWHETQEYLCTIGCHRFFARRG